MSWALGVLGLLVTWAIGICLVIVIDPTLRRDRAARWTALALAMPLGAAAGSCLYWLWLVMLRPLHLPYLTIEALALAATGIGAAHRVRQAEPAPQWKPPTWCTWAVVALALVSALCTLVPAAQWIVRTPHGYWDAWDMWNVKAKYLFYAMPTWTAAFGEPGAHGDYPLLLPATAARVWQYVGIDDTEGTRLVGLYFASSLFVITFAGVARLRGVVAGLIAVTLLPVYPYLLHFMPWQYADIPLITMVVGAVVAAALALEDKPHQTLWLTLTGALAGGAAWTKNEGIVFAAVLLIILAIVLLWRERARKPGWQRVGLAMLGAALPLLCVVWLKLVYGQGSDLAEPRDVAIAELVRDPARHRMILGWGGAFLTHGVGRWMWLAIAAWALLRGARWSAAFALCLALLIVQTAVYYLVYLTTPHDLAWHLGTSVTRTQLHIWVLMLLVPVMLVRPARVDDPAVTQAVD